MTLTPTQPLCFGQTGSVAFTTNGGTGAIAVMNGTTSVTSPNTGLAAGTYTFTATDANGCTLTQTEIINAAPSAIVLTLTPSQPLCVGETGSIAFTTSGGAGAITVKNDTTTATSPVSGLSAGIYTFTATDANGCVKTQTAVINAAPTQVAILLTPTQPLCFGQTGSVTFITSGGTGVKTVKNGTTTVTSPVSGLSAGTYTFTVTDANGCSTTETVTINGAPSQIVLSLTPAQILCNGSTGSISFTTSGGTGAITVKNGTTAVTSPVIGLTAGTYTFTATDANGCTRTSTAVISVAPSAVALTLTPTQPLCANQTGIVTFTVGGGTGAITVKNDTTIVTSPVTGLAGGIYTFTATDANGCTKTQTVTINAAPSQVTILPNINQPLCVFQTGSISFITSGGTGAISVKNGTATVTSPITNLSPGSYTLTATDANLCSTSTVIVINAAPLLINTAFSVTQPLCFGQTGSVVISTAGGTAPFIYKKGADTISNPYTNLASGIYSITTIDANGCARLQTFTVNPVPTQVALNPVVSPILCNGGTASIIPNGSGGTGAFTYQLLTDSLSFTISVPLTNIGIGTYTLVGSDANGCSASTSIIITQPDSLILSASNTQILCNGGTGTISFITSGGTAPRTVTINGSAPASSYTAGTYTVQVTDANGCTKTSIVTIAPAPSAVVLVSNATQPLCSGQTGSISFTTSGGTGTINVTSNGNAVTSPMTSLSAGNYTLVATDGNGCSTSTIITINTSPTALVLTVNATQPLCSNQFGTVTFTTSGGTGTKVVTNGSAAVTSPVIGLVGGTYTFTSTDANGCSISQIVTINPIPAPIVLTINVAQPACFGNKGTVTFFATGGTGTISIKLGALPVTSPLNNWNPGTYSLTATDANGCTKSQTFVVNAAPAAITLSAVATQPLCNGQLGSVAFTTTGGTAPFTFKYGTTTVGNPATGIVPGTYTFTATDANGCTKTVTSSINAAPGPIFLTPIVSHPVCFGGTGSISFTTTGGVGSIVVDNGGTIVSSPVNGLASGNYTLTATDVTGCTLSSIVVISPAPSLISISTTVTQPICPQDLGSVIFTTSGGTGAISVMNNTIVVTSPIVGLAGGVYTLTATDANFCTATKTFSVNSAPSPILFNAIINQPLCLFQTGSISFVPSGGTGAIIVKNGTTTITGPMTNLAAGNYTFTATDALLCSTSTVITINAAPTLINTTFAVTQPLCFGQTGSVVISSAGGVGPYTYKNGSLVIANPYTSLAAGTYSITTTDVNNCARLQTFVVNAAPSQVVLNPVISPILCNGGLASISPNGSGGTGTIVYELLAPSAIPATSGTPIPLTNVGVGTYTLVGTDANGCSTSTIITITQPDSLILSASNTQILCNGGTGTISFITSGGTAPRTVTINGSAPASSYTAGTYTVQVTDANGCTKTSIVTIAPAPSAVVLVSNATQPLCSGQTGSISFTTSGGTGTINVTSNGNAVTSPMTSLSAGNYTLVATDGNGCSTSTIITINTSPTALVLTVNATQPLCSNQFGTVTFTTSGGTGTKVVTNGSAAVTSPVIGLVGGTYTFTSTDANGCSISQIVTINPIPAPIVLTINVAQPACFGNKGTVTFFATGGTGTISIKLGALPVTSPLNNWNPGTYSLTATDANGCTKSQTFVVNAAPAAITLSAVATQPLCNGQLGSVAFTTTGGTAPFTFKYGTTTVGNPATGLVPGTYTFTATDANGCTKTVTSIINVAPSAIVLNTIPTQPLCNGQSGSVAFTTNGGTGIITVNNGSTTVTSPVTGLSAGTYTFTATDVNGCSISTLDTIITPTNPVVLSISNTPILCFADSTIISITTSGGTSPIDITINGLPIANKYTSGTYTISAIDINGCETDSILTITDPSLLVASAIAGTISCNGGTTNIVASAIGGTPGYSYSLNGGAYVTNSSFANITAGNYTINVKDANNCVQSIIINITEPLSVSASAAANNILCNGGTTSIIASATGGTSPYQYSLNNGSFSIGSIFPNQNAGTYTIIAMDANSCSNTATIVISEPLLLSVTPSFAAILCNGGNTSITANAVGGSGMIMYALDTLAPQSSNQFIGVVAGSHTITVTDLNNCVATNILNIVEPSLLSATVTNTSIICAVDSSTLIVTATGGTPGYTYSLVNGSVQASNSFVVIQGIYTLTAIDGNGCAASTIISFTNNDLIPPTIICIDTINILSNNDLCTYTGFILPNPTVSDNCNVQSLFNDHPSPDYLTSSVDVTWTVIDVNNNFNSCKQTINVICKDTALNPDINVTIVNLSLSGNMNTNDNVTLTSYGTPVAFSSNPNTLLPTMLPNGTYTFTPNAVGVYNFNIPVCSGSQTVGCPLELLTITVLNNGITLNPPVANTDIAVTSEATPVIIHSLANDAGGNLYTNLDSSSVTIVLAPAHGFTAINATNGNITYTPFTGFVGLDTIRYSVCDHSSPVNCTQAYQVITVLEANYPNTTSAADDYAIVPKNGVANGNVSINDTDPQGDNLTVQIDTITVAGKGELILDAFGNYTFTPVAGFTGPVSFEYQSCDNGLPISCAKGTVYFVVTESGTVLYAKVLLQGALIAPSVTIMRNDINTLGYLPLSSPYANSSNPRFTNVNGGTATTTPAVLNANINTPNGIVDWVFLEVRSNTTSTGVIQTISALLQRDGDIVDSMGNPLVLNIPGGNYYLSVKHRNHIGALTKNPILVSGQVDTIDFITMPNSAIFANTGYDTAQRILVNGQYALWAGNANQDNKVKYAGPANDLSSVVFNILNYSTNLTQNLNFTQAKGYLDGDINMNGFVRIFGATSDAAIIRNNVYIFPLNISNVYNYNAMFEQIP